jgi:two-component system KDP operon response regulator KdpE
MNESVLIIEDDQQIRNLLRITLESNDHKVLEAENGKSGLLMASNNNPSIILLDLGLPDENGQSILLKIRQWYTKPVIILSVQNDETNIITALDHGANDYLTKPFRTGELLARIRSVLRIYSSESDNSLLKVGNLEIDLKLRVVKRNNELIKLTATEYALLALFIKNDGKVLTHEFLLKNVWGNGYTEQSQYLRVFIAQLRKKIEDDINKPKLIRTESGVGYRFVSNL